MKSVIGNMTEWNFDFKVVFLTLVISPLIVYLFGLIRKFLRYWSGYILEALMFYMARSLRGNLAGRLTLRRYCRLRLGEDNRYLFVPSSLDVKLEVDNAYVTLMLEHHVGERSLLDHTNLLKLGNRIRVIGDPGSGKSSLVKRLMRDSCRQAISKPKISRLPVLIELKKLQVPPKKDEKELGSWLLQKIKTDSAKNSVYKMEECFDAYVDGEGLLILLDGLDEVASSEYHRVYMAISGLSRKLSERSEKNAVILTMRTQFHSQVKDSFRDSFGHAVMLRSFTPTNIYEFLSRWPFSENSNLHVNRIYKELTDHSSLREMCSNPLVLSMYVAEDQAKGTLVAPESRTEFYKKVTEELLIKRRLSQTGPTPASSKLRELREQILGKIAYEHMLSPIEPANSLNWGRAISLIQEIMGCEKSRAVETFHEIAKETGLISEERPSETFRFIHLTFCEFLAALEAVNGQSSGWDDVLTVHTSLQRNDEPYSRSRLVEMIPFAAGLLPRVKRVDAIDDLIALDDQGLLARTFLETKSYDHIGWGVFIKKWRDSLLKVSEEAWGDEWLRELHLFNVVLRDAIVCSTHMAKNVEILSLDDFFNNLVSRQKESLFKILKSYASQDAAAAFRLAEINKLNLAIDYPEIVLENCDQAPFWSMVIEEALREKNNSLIWAPLLAEAALRSKPVAKNMSVMDPMVEWNEFVECKGTGNWHSGSILNRSLLSQCLAISLGESVIRGDVLGLLKIMACAPVPKSHRYSYLTAFFLFFPVAIAGVLFSEETGFLFTTYTGFELVNFVPLLIGGISFFSFYYIIFKTQSTRMTYRKMIFGNMGKLAAIELKLPKNIEVAVGFLYDDLSMLKWLVDRKIRRALDGMSDARKSMGIST